MIGIILSIFKPFRWMIQKMGADYNQFISLMRLKLIMDSRRENNSYALGGTLSKQIFIQVLFGFIFAYIASKLNLPSLYVYIFIHTMIMMMMSLMIISDFTTILFDTSENSIIQPLPVKGNTISLARNAHVSLYLSAIAFFLSCPTLLFAGYRFGILSALLFLVTIILNAIFTLFLANILYLVIMRFANAEKLKNFVMYFQIFVTILFMGGMQLGSSLVSKSLFSGILLSEHWYNYLFPPVFFAGFIDAITNLNFDPQHLLFVAETLFLPLLAVYGTSKYLTPAFNRKLIDLEQGDRGFKLKKPVKRKGFWFWIMASVFVHHPEEKASFTMVWRMSGRERQFKQTFFPSIGILIIVMASQFFRKHVNLSQLIQSDQYLFLLYFTGIVAINLNGALQVGSSRQATWILKTIPLSSPAEFFKGSIKAAFSRFFLPFYLLASIPMTVLFGIRILPDVIIVLLLIYLLTCIMYYFQDLNFPFTMDKEALKGSERTMKMFFLLILMLPLGYFHRFLLHWITYSNLLLIPVYSFFIYFLNSKIAYRRITWKAVNKVNQM